MSRPPNKKGSFSLFGKNTSAFAKTGGLQDMQMQLDILQQESRGIAEKLPALLLAAERVASTVSQGVHGRKRAGMGESFWQYRNFQQEDGRSKIDWRRSARSDALFVRETEWEAAQTLWIWRDPAASLNYTSKKKRIEKGIRADIIALALAFLVLKSSEKVGILGQSNQANSGKAQLPRLAQHLLHNREKEISPEQHLALIRQLPAHSHILLISDFLEPLTQFETRSKLLANKKIQASFLNIFDPAEQNLPFKGRIRFTGFRNETPVLIRKAQSLRPDYQEKRQAHFGYLESLCRHYGWHWLSHSTKNPAESCLLSLFRLMQDQLDHPYNNFAGLSLSGKEGNFND